MHEACAGRVAKAAAIYPFKLCRTISAGCRNQLVKDGLFTVGAMGMDVAHEALEQMEYWPDAGFGVRLCAPTDETAASKSLQTGETPAMVSQGVKIYKDALTGQPLIPQLVMAARRLELEYFESKHVWDKRPREESFRRMGRAPVSVKWVDTKKGDQVPGPGQHLRADSSVGGAENSLEHGGDGPAGNAQA